MSEGREEFRKKINELAGRIQNAAYEVANTLGVGFVEKVYENALAHELRKAGMKVEQQYPVTVHYDGVVVGEYTADLLVEGLVIVEIKAAKALDSVHIAQCLNYLKATGLKLGLLINFGTSKIDCRRIVLGL